ncbi:MAG: extracellular solute-binding protein [Clostridia bacterium]|nr:extracellular solute-binding protein [Clostridia bacterium]
MKKKIVLLFSIILAMVCVMSCFVACDDNSGTEDDLTGSITVWWPGGSTSTEAAITEAKERYEAEHEDVTINIVFQSTSDFYASYTMALMGKSYPDVAYVDHVYVQRLAYDGLISDLSALGLDSLKDTYIDSLWEPNLYNDTLYALPMSANVLTRVYNKALLSKVLGREFTEDDLPSNWEEYIALGELISQYNTDNNLTGNNKLYLTTIPAGTGNESMGAMFFLSYSAREGATLMNDDLTEMTLSSEGNFSAAEKIKYLADNGYTTTTFSESGFENGRVAFIEMGPWKLTDYSRIDAASDDIDYGYSTVMPFEDGGDISSALGLYSLVITKKSAKQQLAADFISFVTTDTEVQLAHNTVQNLMPVTKVAIQDEYYQAEEWQVFVEQLNYCVARPGSAAWSTIEKYLAEYVTTLINGTRDVDYLYTLQAALTEKLEDLEDL